MNALAEAYEGFDIISAANDHGVFFNQDMETVLIRLMPDSEDEAEATDDMPQVELEKEEFLQLVALARKAGWL